MTDTPLMTDRAALMRHRARARANPALFLHDIARNEAEDRLAMVNRSFTAPAIVSPFPQAWSDLVPNARIVSDDDLLDLEEGAHDLVIHALALHWANDPVGQLIQCRRALRPDGLFLGISLGGRTLHELRAALGQAEIDMTGGLSPRVAPMGEIRDLGGLLQRAGFALPVADSMIQNVSYENAMRLMHDLRAMGETNALSQRPKHTTRRAVILRATELYADTFGADGRVPATFEFVTLTGWAPDDSQPKALRPGSAAARLSDALGTQETKLGD